jgi:hypothetical protein
VQLIGVRLPERNAAVRLDVCEHADRQRQLRRLRSRMSVGPGVRGRPVRPQLPGGADELQRHVR